MRALRVLSALAVCAAAVTTPASLDAQSAQGHGIAGFWSMAPGPTPPRRAATPAEAELLKQVREGAVLLADAGATEFPPGDYGGLNVRASLREAAKSYDPESQTDVSLTCRPPGVIYSMQGPFPIEVFQGTELTVIRLEYFDMARVIFTDGRKHLPAGAPLTKTGDSIGHWEGDTLVVDTIHLKEATITNNGLSHSDKIHVIERFKLSADGKKLLSTQEFEDPETLLNKGVRFITWNRVEGDHVHAYDCDPSFAENYAK